MGDHRSQPDDILATLARQVQNFRDRLARAGVDVAIDVGAPLTKQVARLQEAVLGTLGHKAGAEEALRKSEERYRELFETMQEALFVIEVLTDAQGNPVDWRYVQTNPHVERYMGMTREQLVGRTYREVVPRPDPAWIHLLGTVALTGQPVSTEMYAPTHGRWLQVNAYSPRARQAAVLFTDITDRKQTEEELQRAKEEYRLLVEHQTDMVALMSRAGQRLYVNPNFLRMVGKTEAEVVNTAYAPEIHPDDQARVAAEWQGTFEPPYYRSEIEARTLTVQGWRWLSWRNTALFDEHGEPTRAISVGRDITEQKRAEEALRESEERLDLIIANSPDTIFEQNSALEYTWIANPAAPVSADAVLGKTDAELLPPAEAVPLTDIKQQVLHTGQPIRKELMLSPGSMARWFDVIYAPRRDAQGRITGILSYSRDITDRKQAEAERERLLAEVEQRATELHDRIGEIQAILDTAPVAIWIAHDPESRRITGNAYADQIVMQTARGSNISRSADPGDAAVTYRVFQHGIELPPEQLPAQRVIATGQPMAPEEMELVFPNGRTLDMVLGAVPLFDTARRVRGAVVAGLDVTELHAAQERERRYLYTLAHNLRAPAAIVKGNIDLLLEALPGGCLPPDAPVVGAIQRGLERMSGMIDDFTLVMLLEAGEVTLCPAPVALAPIVQAATAHRALTLDPARVALDLPSDLPPMQADPKYLQIILQHLLENAEKFSAEGTPIRVAASRQEGETVIAVTDQGIGIAPEDLPHLFDRFYRVARIRSAEGTGLGLFIVKRLAELHGGRVWAESEVGKGSTFSVALPVGQQEESAR